ncbi:hypothetical protein DPMN_128931 [Dreissena polymorpha]|uniref:Uncharacterized protein n=1 Tax=Dreissena polymorpha TaxID=45954 RepID=A0A9D4H1Q8_DREPO|nr:hypothetical protein DPMN_128931 [Dreissena polymorpha]
MTFIVGPFSVTTKSGLEDLYGNHTFDLDRQFLIVILTNKCVLNNNYTLKIPHFRGPLVADLAGLYLSSYKRGNQTMLVVLRGTRASTATLFWGVGGSTGTIA